MGRDHGIGDIFAAHLALDDLLLNVLAKGLLGLPVALKILPELHPVGILRLDPFLNNLIDDARGEIEARTPEILEDEPAAHQCLEAVVVQSRGEALVLVRTVRVGPAKVNVFGSGDFQNLLEGDDGIADNGLDRVHPFRAKRERPAGQQECRHQ